MSKAILFVPHIDLSFRWITFFEFSSNAVVFLAVTTPRSSCPGSFYVKMRCALPAFNR
uniref:Uncharacterized protein n=1 Tax=Utricularia reniformis TaxID=192314 RepID=A0A1Y0AZ19_9LAMI|nr:hypothetical protein AEK19_MT1748 [Utricularia reniformis]ART30404.1 hypothetical protein AEK19_MT1748 [Utricularia reniformis]